MKRIIVAFLVFVSVGAAAQNLDTVIVRNLQLQAQDWAYLVGSYNTTADSAAMDAYRKIRDAVQKNKPASWTTNLTIDSLPGSVVVAFYQIAKTSNAGEIVSRYTAIINAISAKANIAYWVGFIDSAVLNDFSRKRDRGKNLLID